MSATAKYNQDFGLTLCIDEPEAAEYLRDVLAAEWARTKDYGAREIADAITQAMKR